MNIASTGLGAPAMASPAAAIVAGTVAFDFAAVVDQALAAPVAPQAPPAHPATTAATLVQLAIADVTVAPVAARAMPTTVAMVVPAVEPHATAMPVDIAAPMPPSAALPIAVPVPAAPVAAAPSPRMVRVADPVPARAALPTSLPPPAPATVAAPPAGAQPLPIVVVPPRIASARLSITSPARDPALPVGMADAPPPADAPLPADTTAGATPPATVAAATAVPLLPEAPPAPVVNPDVTPRAAAKPADRNALRAVIRPRAAANRAPVPAATAPDAFALAVVPVRTAPAPVPDKISPNTAEAGVTVAAVVPAAIVPAAPPAAEAIADLAVGAGVVPIAVAVPSSASPSAPADRADPLAMPAIFDRALPLPGHHLAAIAPAIAPPPPVHAPTVSARPGAIGREMGIEIARHVAAGGDTLLVRLDPPDMGRIDVHIRFDDRGSLRAAVYADSAVALDMLRQDSGALGRALTGAGVATDAQSFSFDTRSSDSGQSQGRPADPRQPPTARRGDAAPEASDPASYRPLRWTGQVDVMA